jgi:hypothetical protein
VATLEDLEARVAALEASRADYCAVMAAVNALGANQREHALDLAGVKTDVAAVKTYVAVLKTDVSVLKTDLAAVKVDVTAVKNRRCGRQDGAGRFPHRDASHVPLGRRAPRRDQGPDHRPSQRSLRHSRCSRRTDGEMLRPHRNSIIEPRRCHAAGVKQRHHSVHRRNPPDGALAT